MNVQNMGTSPTRLLEFTRMNSPKFHGSDVDEDQQELIDKVYRIMAIIRVSLYEKAKLVDYQFKGIARVWYEL